MYIITIHADLEIDLNSINLKSLANTVVKKNNHKHNKSKVVEYTGITLYNMLRLHREKKRPPNEYFYQHTMGKLKDDLPSSKFTIESDVDEYRTNFYGKP